MGKLVNRAKMTVASAPGTGPYTLGAAVAGYQTFAAAGVNNGDVVTAIVEDGSNWQFGEASYSSTGPTLTFTQILGSSNGGAAISASSAALVFISPLAQDLQNWPGGLINKFRNGTMDIAQRGTSGSAAAGTQPYTLDGWQVWPTGAAAAWAQEYNANLAGNALRISAASGLTACLVQQHIESTIAAELLTASKGLQPVTLQWTIFNNSGAAITPQVSTGYAATPDNFSTVTVDLAPVNGQTIAQGAVGVVAYTFTPTSANLANGYQAQLLLGGALNGSSGYVDISRADIRATPTAAAGLNMSPPPPELRPIFAEMPFNQRYFYSTYGNGVAPGTAGTDGTALLVFTGPTANANSYLGPTIYFSMRAGGVTTVYNPHTGGTGSAWAQNSAASLSAAAVAGSTQSVTLALNNQPVAADDFVKFHATISAEL